MSDAMTLVVEDDGVIGEGLVRALALQGHAAELATSGAGALAAARALRPALVLLDLGLPDLDGIDLCRRLRQELPAAAIVILTARAEEIDIVVGLDAGADDYLVKPFRLAELLARVRAHLRRRPVDGRIGDLRAADVHIDAAAHRVWVGERELELRPKEYDLLVLLVSEAGRAVTREWIMAEVWDEHWHGSTKTLDMHVSQLRRKMGETGGGPDAASRITTLRGVGYRFEQT
ncbi:MAG: response regulator transcription factor [Acidimicrobiales bacterium]